jgi:hypothetical protein
MRNINDKVIAVYFPYSKWAELKNIAEDMGMPVSVFARSTILERLKSIQDEQRNMAPFSKNLLTTS